MVKKIAALLISVGLIMNLSMPVQAITREEDGNREVQEVIDITEDEKYVVSEGQIELGNINLKNSGEELLIEAKERSIETSLEMIELKKHLDESEELKLAIISALENGNDLVGIGYSEVMVEKNNNGEIIPVTKERYLNSRAHGQGASSSKGKLKLYTVGESYMSNGKKNIIGISVATWSGFGYEGPDNPSSGADYISVTLPSRYVLYNHKFFSKYYSGSGITKNWSTAEGDRDIVYAFEESPGSKWTKDVQLTAYGSSTNTSAIYEKIVSQYVHSYGSVSITPSIGTGGVSFSISNSNKAWKISSSLTLTF